MCGTITPGELKTVMPSIDWKNGSANRFLWSIAYRDKKLARSTKRPDFTAWAERVKKLRDLNLNVQPTAIDYAKSGSDAFEDWHKPLPEHDDSILADSQGRVEANLVRVAVLYSMLDERRLTGWKPQLEAKHVEAAIEIVNRSRQSVEWYLSQQQAGPVSKVTHSEIHKLKTAYIKNLRLTGVAEMSATEIYELFPNSTLEHRDEICMAADFKASSKKTARGKAVMIWKE